jgi:hypothetical protein
MAQQFALENLASKINLSEKRARQDYVNKQARDATKLLEKQLDDMQKKASEKGGIFGQFGKNAGLFKTLSTIALNAIPGFGQAAAFALNAADLAKSQSDMKENIKKVSQAKGVPARFAGTFLEDYLRSGLMGAQSQLKSGLQGGMQTNLLTGLASLVPSALGAAGQAGDLLNITQKVVDPANVAKNIMAGTGGKSNILNVVKSAGTKVTEPTNFSNILNKLKSSSVPGSMGAAAFKDLLKPLAETGIENPTLKALASSALTPANYAPLLQDLYMNYLTKPAGEPVMTRASAPKVY